MEEHFLYEGFWVGRLLYPILRTLNGASFAIFDLPPCG